MGTTDLFIFRHGETDWNREKRFQGHTNIPLNEEGIRQAKELVNRIRPCRAEVMLSSDLMRARVTAEIVNQELQLPLLLSQELRECALGDPEGLSRAELLENYGELSWQKWLSIRPEDLDFSFPNGESKRAHLHRLKSYLEGFCKKNPQYKRIGVSTHGGGLRRLVHSCDGAPADPVPLPNCVLYHIKFGHRSSKWVFLGRVE